jgi:hypothetical protein
MKCKGFKDRFLFLPNVPQHEKAGKLTDELADDVAKYIGKKEASILLANGFPDMSSGFCGRVVETVSPFPKVNFVKVIFPPSSHNGIVSTSSNYVKDTNFWHVAYKTTCKGIPKGAYIQVGDSEQVIRFEQNAECFQAVKKAVYEGMPLHCSSYDRLRKVCMRINNKQLDKGMEPFSIFNIDSMKRTILRTRWEGRTHVKRDNPIGEGFFGKNHPYTVPLGYQETPYSNELIEQCYEEANKLEI